jgi:hypothetical protein
VTAPAAGWSPLQLLADLGQLALIWLMIPLGILLVGIPIVLVISGLVKIGEMLFGG